MADIEEQMYRVQAERVQTRGMVLMVAMVSAGVVALVLGGMRIYATMPAAVEPMYPLDCRCVPAGRANSTPAVAPAP